MVVNFLGTRELHGAVECGNGARPTAYSPSLEEGGRVNQVIAPAQFPIGRVRGEPPLKLMDRLLQRWRIAKVQRYIPVGASVLDVGCADGALFRQLNKRIRSGVGVDYALEESVSGGPFKLFAGSLSDYGAADEAFDAITMLAVVEHLPESAITKVRNECVRVLKPGGVLLITVPSRQVDQLLEWLIKMHLVAGMSLHEHHGFDPADLPALFAGPDLRLVRSARFQLGLNNLFVFRKTTQVLE